METDAGTLLTRQHRYTWTASMNITLPNPRPPSAPLSTSCRSMRGFDRGLRVLWSGIGRRRGGGGEGGGRGGRGLSGD